MLLLASSGQGASDMHAALARAGFEVWFQLNDGGIAVATRAAADRDAEVLDIAKGADPAVQAG